MSLHDRGAPAPIRRAVLPTPRFVLLFAISGPIALLIVSLRPEAWRFALLYPVAALARPLGTGGTAAASARGGEH